MARNDVAQGLRSFRSFAIPLLLEKKRKSQREKDKKKRSEDIFKSLSTFYGDEIPEEALQAYTTAVTEGAQLPFSTLERFGTKKAFDEMIGEYPDIKEMVDAGVIDRQKAGALITGKREELEQTQQGIAAIKTLNKAGILGGTGINEETFKALQVLKPIIGVEGIRKLTVEQDKVANQRKTEALNKVIYKNGKLVPYDDLDAGQKLTLKTEAGVSNKELKAAYEIAGDDKVDNILWLKRTMIRSYVEAKLLFMGGTPDPEDLDNLFDEATALLEDNKPLPEHQKLIDKIKGSGKSKNQIKKLLKEERPFDVTDEDIEFILKSF